MKNVSLLTLVLSVVVLFTGCAEVTFPEPMPFNRSNKSAFPQAWCGTWNYNGSSDALSEVMSISPQYIGFEDKNLVLGEENVLRRFNGYYILSTIEEREERWVIYLAKRNGNVLSIYQFDGEDEEKVKLWESLLLPEQFEKVTKPNNDAEVKEFQINPGNNATLRKLINGGGLTHVGDYVR
jgi:hypothetical protein